MYSLNSIEKNHHQCNLFMHSTVSQIKIREMLFLSTCHINSPQKNLTAVQPSPHQPHWPTQHTGSSSKSQGLHLNPRLLFSYFNRFWWVPGKAEAAAGLSSTVIPADECQGPHFPTRKSPMHSQNTLKHVSASSVRHRMTVWWERECEWVRGKNSVKPGCYLHPHWQGRVLNSHCQAF